jgi:hypothetical protein
MKVLSLAGARLLFQSTLTTMIMTSVSICLFRVNMLKRQLKHLYVVVAVPTKEQNESFNRSYHKYAPIIMLMPEYFS